MKYDLHFIGKFHALVSIYRADGTVAITTGASEMGQGVNTKVSIDGRNNSAIIKLIKFYSTRGCTFKLALLSCFRQIMADLFN